jgi:hypothetical protein
MGTLIQMGACLLSSYVFKEDSAHVLKSTALVELLQSTHLNACIEAVVLLVEGSSDPRRHDEGNAVEEDMVS